MNGKAAISYQLYFSRNFPDLARQCRMLRDIGYAFAEPFGGLIGDISALERALKDNGLAAPTCHIGLPSLRQDCDSVIAKLKTIGCGFGIAPAPPPDERVQDKAGWQRFGAELSGYAKRFNDAGLKFGWHNHHVEFAAMPDGTVALESVLGDNPNVLWQVDFAWIIRGKADPLRWIARYKDRVAAFHVKDIAADGECADEDGWADVGAGTVDFAKLLPAMRGTAANVWVAEHDNPKDDARFARRSLAAMKSWS